MFHVYIPLLFSFLAVFLLLFSLYFDFFNIFSYSPLSAQDSFVHLTAFPFFSISFSFVLIEWFFIFLFLFQTFTSYLILFFPGKTARDKFNNTQVPKPQDMSNQKKLPYVGSSPFTNTPLSFTFSLLFPRPFTLNTLFRHHQSDVRLVDRGAPAGLFYSPPPWHTSPTLETILTSICIQKKRGVSTGKRESL